MNEAERGSRRNLEVARSNAHMESFRNGMMSSPYFYIGMSPVVGFLMFQVLSLLWPMSNTGIVLSLVAALAIFVRGMVMLDRRPSPARKPRKTYLPAPSADTEKQLLRALRSHGSLTPVEAALETTLTVDESDRMLSRLADKGHLRVEVKDGVLSYGLPASGTERPTVV